MPAIKIARAPKYVLSDGITQSMLSVFLKCRQYSKFSLDRWQPKISNSQYLDFGDFFHFLLEHYYNPNAYNLKNDADLCINCFNYCKEKWIENAKKKGPIDIAALESTCNEVYSVWPWYCKNWAKRDSKFKWPALELVFDVNWRGFRLRGKIDGLLDIASKDWTFETKTKSQIAEDDITDCLTFDLQNLFYITALQQIGRKPIGNIYNIVRNPSLRQKKEESPDDFQARVEEDIAKRPEHYFKRFEVTYTEAQIKRFQDELFFKLTDFKAWIEGKIPTYRNETACVGRGRCPFLSACSSGNMVGYSQNKVLFRELLP